MRKIPQINDYNYKLKIKDELFTPQSGVTLNGGLFKETFDNNFKFLEKLDDGKMSYWFDLKAGRPTDAEPYKGHFEDNLKGSTLSMFLMGACNMLRWTEDEALEARVEKLAAVLRDTMEEDGFAMPVDQRRFAYKEYPHYVRIWLTYALAAYGMAMRTDGYTMLRKWQDWFNNCPDLPIIKFLELAFQGVVASPYVYTSPIGRKEDIEKCIEVYEEPWRLAQFMRREKDCVHVRNQPGREPHAHGTELESFEGYLDLYKATGRNYYLDAVLGAWELFNKDWEHPGGGIVMCEGMTGKNYPGCYWLTPENNYNELCCTSFWLFLNQRLHRLFPDEEKYVSEIEKSIYNIAIANQDNGDGIRYFGYLDGQKQASGLVHCCCGVGTRIFGCLPEFIYSLNYDTVSVNLYAPSTLNWEAQGVKIDMEADAAYSDSVKLTIATDAPKTFKLRLRIPNWSADCAIYLNNELIAAGKAGTFTEINHEFKDGDTITYNFTRSWKFTKYTGADQIAAGKLDRYYIEKGPLLYAVTGSKLEETRLIGWTTENFENWLTETENGYEIAMHPGYKLVPYYTIDSGVNLTACPIMGYSTEEK